MVVVVIIISNHNNNGCCYYYYYDTFKFRKGMPPGCYQPPICARLPRPAPSGSSSPELKRRWEANQANRAFPIQDQCVSSAVHKGGVS